MKICGLQKTTLLDFPGKVAATLFTGGCNFRCPFCHNSDLLLGNARELYKPEDVLGFLEKRRNILEGVCITGGEPTLQPDLADFIRDIRTLGLAVKLDTNGYRPEILEELCGHELLDYIMEYRMFMAEELIRHLKPNVVLSYDDWGAKDRLFMDPDTFREFFKDRYEKLYAHIKEVGKEVGKDIVVIHHADSHCAEIIDDMADMHIDIWQGVLPSNDVPALQPI